MSARRHRKKSMGRAGGVSPAIRDDLHLLRSLPLASELRTTAIGALGMFRSGVADRVDLTLRPASRACFHSADEVAANKAQRMRPLEVISDCCTAAPTGEHLSAPVSLDLLPRVAAERCIVPARAPASIPRHGHIIPCLKDLLSGLLARLESIALDC